jgi:hypothetical protein
VDVANSLRTFQNGKLRTIIGADGQEQLPVEGPGAGCKPETLQCGLAGSY